MGSSKKEEISDTPLSKESSTPTSQTDKTFNKQDKNFDFRQEEIIKYRKDAKETLNKDVDKRLKKIISKPHKEEKITKEKLDNRIRPYGEGLLTFKFEKIGKSKKFRYVARNRKTKKIEGTIKEIDALTEKEHKQKLLKQLDKKDFDFQKHYIIEDSEPIKTGDKRKDTIISYNTFYRYGVIIYRMKKGRKYEVIYQDSNTQARSVYISYQRIIAQFKDDILKDTGITIEEWIFLSKTKSNIFIEGGLNYKRFKNVKVKDETFKSKLDYQVVIDFESL